MRIRIKKFSITSYRSCLSTTLDPHPALSALIGKNASGKSSLLNGILLLRSLLSPESRARSSNRTQARSRINTELSVGDRSIFLRADVYYTATQTSKDEVLDVGIRWNFKNLTGIDEWITLPPLLGLTHHYHSYVWNDAQIWHPSPQRVFSQRNSGQWKFLRMPKSFEKKIRPFLKLSEPIFQFFSGISYYSASQFTDPTRCPVSLEIEDEHVFKRGLRVGDHAKFLHDLYRLQKVKSREYDEFFSIVGPGGLRLIDGFSFKEYSLPQSRYEVRVGGKVVREKLPRQLLIPYFKVDGNRLSPNQLSEGTFKTIALLFYLVVDKGSLLLIEEPEVCVHHGLLKSIMELVRSYSVTKQIIISTHSDFVLDLMDPENVFLVKKIPHTGTKVTPVNKTLSANEFNALKTYLAESGNLGEFWRHGGFSHD